LELLVPRGRIELPTP